jgi:hypothetical protein
VVCASVAKCRLSTSSRGVGWQSVLMSSCEEVVTELVGALAYLERALVLKKIELRDAPEMSEITHAFETSQNALAISGYVDAALEGARGVAWTICLWREGPRWKIDREVTLYPNTSDDVINRLPDLDCDSEELGRVLPGLVDELLRLPVPSLPSLAEG